MGDEIRVSYQYSYPSEISAHAVGSAGATKEFSIMSRHSKRLPFSCSRRVFLQTSLGTSAALLARGTGAAEPPSSGLSFVHDPPQFAFDTGALRGALRQDGLSRGLMPLTDGATGKQIARAYGVFSHYRLLDAETRYGDGAWSWPSQARLRDDGAVVIDWTFEEACPFTMQAVYEWADPLTLDLRTTVTARRQVQRLEVFLASYLDGFPVSFVYVQGTPLTGGRPGFLEATRQRGVWQMSPRDEAAVRVIQDGRWQRLPHPVEWQILPHFAAPLVMRRDPESGLAVLVMARAEDCFAVSTPYGEESHRSLYLSLLGCDLDVGQTRTAHARLAIRRDLSERQAIECYETFQAGSL
ncbi:MAG: hypothetical protein EA424_01775 [Planctomycetaceae bacterium]|nr:MAG: hypothetical protein EA424_01775 [Planctomycetaceae bacterium]